MPERTERRQWTRGERATLITKLDTAFVFELAGDEIAAERVKPSPASVKLVLFVLDQLHGQRDHCWPSVPTVAKFAGMKRRATQAAIKATHTWGLVEYVDERVGVSSRTYAIDYDRAFEFYCAQLLAEVDAAGGDAELTARALNAPGAWTLRCGGVENTRVGAHCARPIQTSQSIERIKRTRGGFALRRPRRGEGPARARAAGVYHASAHGVNDKAIPHLLRKARTWDRGDTLDRVAEVCSMADCSAARNPAGFIRSAILGEWTSSTRASVR